ncbi:capsid assembly scaffolding protein Gp46 family protein [Rothia nasimurium]|uniref:capsid assembly scaffolding protein Gp46 family protein n=1 Tax=Rothia nasimurium TaxID=85336 RepID=UPI003B9ED57C
MDKMPWEREGETFDAERAKTLLLNLRAEKENYQAKLAAKTSELEALTTERDELKTQLETAQATAKELEEQSQATAGELQALNLLRAKEQILTSKGLPVDFADLLTGDDEQALEAAAERLSTLRGATDSAPAPMPADPAQTGTPASDPRQEYAEALFGH